MVEPASDQDLLRRIDELIAEEHRLYRQQELTITDRDRLDALAAELDRLWDLLRRRRAQRQAGVDAGQGERPGRGHDTEGRDH